MKQFNIIVLALLIAAAVFVAGVSSAVVRPYNATCMQAAVMEREIAVGEVYQTFIDGAGAAFEARSAGLIAAYGIEDAKLRANETKYAWKTYKEEIKILTKNLRDSRKAAWKNFTEAVKMCNGRKEAFDLESNELKI